MFVTLFFGVLDPRSGRLLYCNAGHNAPYVTGAGGTRALESVRGVPLGVRSESAYRTVEAALVPGETLFVFSDGITEATNEARELYGEERLERALAACRGRAAEEVIGSVMTSVAAFVGEAARSDDITAMAIRLR